MKQDRLFAILTDVDDDLIEEAATPKKTIPFIHIASVAVAAAVLVSVALLPRGERFAPVAPEYSTPIGQTEPTDEVADNAISTVDTTTISQSQTNTTTALISNGVVSTTAQGNTTIQNATTTVKPTATAPTKHPEIALVPKWEDKTIKQKFPEIPYGAATYSVYYAVDPKQVGDKLTTVTATGQDLYTDTYHTTAVTLYRLGDMAPQCAVAIQYEGDADYYSAVATWYQPLTLGEFLDGLQLKKYGVFGEASWDYFDEVYHYRTYTGVSAEAVFDLLLDDPSLPNVHDDQQHFYDTINISVDLPILGLENPVVMMLSEDGYLFTNILGCGKTFYVGTARVEAFKAYLQNNCACAIRAVTTQTVAEPTETQPPVTGTTTAKPAQPPRTSGAFIPE